ncbi:MAG: S-methyl-5-thioribose-1-phosphate isomerase [Alicyclobacillus herbarius]|nr:S-methyl-5-thioribose-1-phosphate isomerase [Alicyclobacillus herbarius]MCL6631440.1 S-methyl-5-thioribose-1-phosphate isomerase [Alicyclobacillus herbarius]
MNALNWTGQSLRLLDQRKLPHEEVWEEFTQPADVADAILHMKVRGAPAIAAAAAYGIALGGLQLPATESAASVRDKLERVCKQMAETRPTAVNLFWAIGRMKRVLEAWDGDNLNVLKKALVAEADHIAQEDIEINRQIGRNGAKLIARRGRVAILTHCNTGSLATAGYGTALGVIRALHEMGRLARVFVDETRPYLQGARLTAYELGQENIPHLLITDSMAAYYMQQGAIDAVVVGADRIAANGDTANKIGTYAVAVLAHHHRIPFYVAAPVSTFDLTIADGAAIPIEQRAPEEVTHFAGVRIAPERTPAAHPAFDVTPHELIQAIICEKGVIDRPDREKIATVLGDIRP